MNWDLEAFLRNGALMPAGQDDFWIGLGLKAVADPSGFCWFAPDYYLQRPAPWFRPSLLHRCSRAELLNGLTKVMATKPCLHESRARSFADFADIFASIQLGIKRGSWRKVVPISIGEYDSELRSSQVAYCLNHMLRQPTSLSPYGMWDEQSGLLGASPEWLFIKEAKTIRTMAMAGSRWDHCAQLPLQEDAKQRWEHLIVVEDIRDALSSIGTVEVADPEVVQLPGLSHLKTEIFAHIRDNNSYESVVRCLHPTPALGDSPRGAGQEIFRMMDSLQDRRRFGAPFGIVEANGDGTCLVAIRNLQWEWQKAYLAVGCGVVADSRLEVEWAELAAKESAVRGSLGL